MRRPPCPKCSGYLQKILEHHAVRLPVVRCLICGWRTYLPGHCVDTNIDGTLALVRLAIMEEEEFASIKIDPIGKTLKAVQESLYY
jgi:hypothetical protein